MKEYNNQEKRNCISGSKWGVGHYEKNMTQPEAVSQEENVRRALREYYSKKG